MSSETVKMTVRRLIEDDLLGKSLVVNWHSGEPLVLSAGFYEERISLFSGLPDTNIEHTMQTNGILLQQSHCDLFKRHGVKVGLSLDGPAFIHDAHRPTRSGGPTFRQAMKAVDSLHAASIPFKIIAVLSDASLAHPNELYDFFLETGCEAVGFNFEEMGGENHTSSMQVNGFAEMIDQFLEVFWHRVRSEGNKFRVREFDECTNRIKQAGLRRNCQVEPLLNISVGSNGDWSTYCPELLDDVSSRYGDFRFGNVHARGFLDALGSEKFHKVASEIAQGVAACKSECDYFDVCYGGNPSNKVAENGTFNSTLTLACRYRTMSIADFVMRKLETEVRH